MSVKNPGANPLLDGVNHNDTLAGTVVRGDIVVGNATPKWARVAKGAAQTILRSDGTDPSWSSQLIVGSNGPHIIGDNGGSFPSGYTGASLLMNNVFTPTAADGIGRLVLFGNTLNAEVNAAPRLIEYSVTMVEAGSGVHAGVVGQYNSLSITNGAGATTDAITVQVHPPSKDSGTVTGNAITLYVDGAPTIGAGNWAAYIAGKTTVEGLFDVLSPDNSTAVTIKINATQANITGADKFVSFASTSGEEANVVGTGVAGIIAYNTFTGSHKTLIDTDPFNPEPLMLLEMTGELLGVQDFLDLVTAPGQERSAPKEYLPRTRVCTTHASDACYGVYAGRGSNGMHMALALGTGKVLLAKTSNAPIPVGTFLVSSTTPGHTEIQHDNIKRASTVAVTSESITWQPGQTARQVAVRYLMG